MRLHGRLRRPRSTPRSGSRTTCRTGARGRRAPPPTSSTGSELRLTIPPEHGLWCSPEHDPAAGLGDPVRRLLGRGRQHDRPAAVPRRPGGARVPAGAVGLDAAPRAARGARADGAEPALDGRGVDGRARGRARALRRDLHLRGLRRRARARKRGRRHGRPPVPRPRPHRRVRGAAGRDRRHRAPRLRRRLAARDASTSSSTASSSRPCTRPRTTRCR